jgi:hypothetical protein
VLCTPCTGQRQSASDVSYVVSSTFDNNHPRFSDPSIGSEYGWVSANHGINAHLYMHFTHPTHVSGLFHAGATMGSIGATKFTVRYSKSSPAAPDTFVHHAYAWDTHSIVFESGGDNCAVEFTVFHNVYNSTALLITPVEWNESVNNAIDAPGMRVAVETCV